MWVGMKPKHKKTLIIGPLQTLFLSFFPVGFLLKKLHSQKFFFKAPKELLLLFNNDKGFPCSTGDVVGHD